MPLDRRHVRGSQALPQAGRRMAAVAHADAGAADHRVETVALHEASERRPQRQDHAAGAPFGVDAGAPEFDHALAQRTQPGEIELGVGVETSGASRRSRCHHPVGAHHDRRLVGIGLRAHQQVLAIGIEDIDIVARWRAVRRREMRAHLLREDLVAQALRAAQIGLVAGPQHFQRCGRPVCGNRGRLRLQS